MPEAGLTAEPPAGAPKPPVADRLERVRADHPGHSIKCTLQYPGRPMRFEAKAVSLGIHPSAVITDDLAELDAALG